MKQATSQALPELLDFVATERGLFAEQDGGTALTIKWSPLNADASERATFAAGHGSMRQGWTGTLDQLAGYLAKA